MGVERYHFAIETGNDDRFAITKVQLTIEPQNKNQGLAKICMTGCSISLNSSSLH